MSFEKMGRPELPSMWKRPNLQAEQGELIRTAGTLDPDKDPKKFGYAIYLALQDVPLQELSDDDWSRLENTDSWAIEKGDFETVATLADKAGRDWKKIKNNLETGTEVEAPSIISYRGRLHKIGGNTRLMVAKAMGIRPMVVMTEFKEDSK